MDDDRIASAADLERVVMGVHEVNESGSIVLIEIEVKIRTNENFSEELERAGGSRQGLSMSHWVSISFTPIGDYTKPTYFVIKHEAGVTSGQVDSYVAFNIRTFPATFDNGTYKAIVPIQGLAISASDRISASSFSVWDFSKGFSYMSSDDSGQC